MENFLDLKTIDKQKLKEEKADIELKEHIKAYQINIGELLTTQESLGLNGVAIKNSIKHHLKTETLSKQNNRT